MKNTTFTKSQHALMPITFEQLPEAVSQVLSRLVQIERLLEHKDNKTQPEQDDLLVIEDASKFLHLSSPTIYTLVSNRKIPFMKKGKRLYFSKKALTQWLVESKKDPIS
jgi:excisionase family DNA binding protein